MLQGQVATLKARVRDYERGVPAGLDETMIRTLQKLLHPDRHGGSREATEASQWINAVRDKLKTRH